MSNTARLALKAGYRFFKDDVVYGTLLYRYGLARHRALLKTTDRSQNHTYTCFYRSPGQLDALCGPVLAYLQGGRTEGKLQINLFASSTGAESFTLASVLVNRFPGLDFQITASDLHQEMVDRAQAAIYSREEVYRAAITDEFVLQTFEHFDGRYRVRPEIRARVTFRQANLLDPELGSKFEPADIVFAQNVFCHLNQEMSRTAFANIVQFLKPRSALFVDGMELDMREELTAKAGLSPLDHRTREIHEFARKHIGEKWWTYYYGMEPYSATHPSRVRRFSTIFFKGKQLEVKRFANWQEAAPYRDAWNKLVTDGAKIMGSDGIVPSLFQTFEWNETWWQTYGKGHELLLLAAFDGETLVGVAPLMLSRRWLPLPGKVVRLLGGANFASDYCGFVRAPGAAGCDVVEAFCSWLASNPAHWDQVEFLNVPETAPELACLERRLGAAGQVMTYLTDAPTRLLGVPAEDQDLVNRKSLKRHVNWFNANGKLECSHHVDAAQILPRLDAFFEQHIGRRAVAGAKSQFHDERHREFYRLMVQRLAPLGWLKFTEIEFNGAPLAFHLGFEFGGKFYWYKPTFDAEFVKKSPGEVLLKKLFEHSIERKLAEFDFTAGSEAFKYRFSNRVRKLYYYRAFRSATAYRLYKIVKDARSLAKNLARRLLRK